MSKRPKHYNPIEKPKISLEKYSQALYQIAMGVAAKMQQELCQQPSLSGYYEKIDNNTLGLLVTGLWLVKHVAKQTLTRLSSVEKAIRELERNYFEYIDNATAGNYDRKELSDYLSQLYNIYDTAWNNLRDPGRSWWLAEAIGKEILDTTDVPELAKVIIVGEIDTTLAMGMRLTRQYIIE